MQKDRVDLCLAVRLQIMSARTIEPYPGAKRGRPCRCTRSVLIHWVELGLFLTHNTLVQIYFFIQS